MLFGLGIEEVPESRSPELQRNGILDHRSTHLISVNTTLVRNVHLDNFRAAFFLDEDSGLMADDWELANGLNPSDSINEFEVTVTGLDPTKTLRMIRGTDLLSYPEKIEALDGAVESHAFTDPAPLDEKAFHIIEEVAP